MKAWIPVLGLIAIVALYQSCGSSNSTTPGTAAPGTPATRQASPQPLAPTYSSLSQNIFAPKCMSCHNASNPSGNTDFTSYDSLVHNSRHTDIAIAGKPEDSHLYMVTEDGEMPPGGPKLSAEELQAIHDWIANGAQNN